MANPPVIVEKKRGLGCLGCGCLIVALLALLFFATVVGVSVFAYHKVVGITATAPETVPAFDGGPDVESAAQQKCSQFIQAASQHQSATLQLSADEINSLIESNPSYISSGAHVFVTLNDDQGQVQFSYPLAALKMGILGDRYANGSVSFTLHLDTDTKQVVLDLKSLRVGSFNLPEESLPSSNVTFNGVLNQKLQANPTMKELLESAKTIEIQGGQLVLETE
jgi:hypothetical protein